MPDKLSGLGELENQSYIYGELHKIGLETIQELKEIANRPSYDKLPKTYTISEVERLIGVSRVTIRDNEKKGNISYPNNSDASKKSEYRLTDIELLRAYFKKGIFNGDVKRPKSLRPIILAMGMFKGGVGKTTQSTHLAAYCAISGLKTCLIDTDPQGSATLTSGYVPSVDLNSGETLYNTLVNDITDIDNIIKPTHYDGLDIIPSGLELQGADLTLPNSEYNNEQELGSPLLRLTKALSRDKLQEYDIIILDLAPNHASVTMNALAAADAIILPLNPTMLSYGSSIQFTETLQSLSEALIRYKESIESSGEDPDDELKYLKHMKNKLFRILITNDEATSESDAASKAIRRLYEDFVLPKSMLHTIALPRSSNSLSLLYDMKRSDIRGSKESFDRGLLAMNMVNEEILKLFKSIWGIKND